MKQAGTSLINKDVEFSMKLKVFKADGSSSTEKDFPHFPEFEGDRGIATLRQVVIAQQANKRQGNASTKTRAEVAGSGKKLFRQKGSGTTRQGTRRVPHQRHGGVAHGPKPRDYYKNESQDAPVGDAKSFV